jgi:hypothetical protein
VSAILCELRFLCGSFFSGFAALRLCGFAALRLCGFARDCFAPVRRSYITFILKGEQTLTPEKRSLSPVVRQEYFLAGIGISL